MSDIRLFKILYYLLDKGRATAPELAARFEVSTRTIYRDVEALSGAGVPVYAEPGKNGGIFLLPGFALDKALLSEQEKREVLTAIQGLSATGYPPGEEVLTKLSALFQVQTGNWLEVDFSCWGNAAHDTTKFERLKTAVIQHREIQILYENTRSETSKRVVQPLKLYYRSREWYLKAFCRQKQDFRLFKLNRILELTVLERTFVPRPYPQAEPGWPPSCPPIVLVFSKEVAYRVYDEFGKEQIERQPNGDLRVCAEMPADAWLTGYLLSFGPQVEVLEPASLKVYLAALAKAVYEKNKP